MRKITTILMLSAVLMFLAAPASADWDPGDGHKMHWPQLPDPNGWDVSYGSGLADDWQCSWTGPVEDIHFWVSWKDDVEGIPFSSITLAIFDDDRSGPFSKPGTQLWDAYLWPSMGGGTLEMTYRLYGDGDQGWFEPVEGGYVEHDHLNYYQVNCTNFTNPFEQEEGTIYWLGVSITPPSGEIGWKTSQNHFEDDAVYLTWDGTKNIWLPLEDPITVESLDLAFVITPEPGTMCLLVLGGIGVLLRRRRSKA